ncbi:hypothetical protein HDU96_002269, partial [Phlyctochytrium bullatum]
MGTCQEEEQLRSDLLNKVVIAPRHDRTWVQNNAKNFYKGFNSKKKELAKWMVEKAEYMLQKCTATGGGIDKDMQLEIQDEYLKKCGAEDPFDGLYQFVRPPSDTDLVVQVFQCPAREHYSMNLHTFIGQLFTVVWKIAETVFSKIAAPQTTIVQIEAGASKVPDEDQENENEACASPATDDEEEDKACASPATDDEEEEETCDSPVPDDEEEESPAPEDRAKAKKEECLFEDEAKGVTDFRVAHILYVLAMIR